MPSIFIDLLPQHALTTFAGWLANCTIPWVKNLLIRYFLWQYPINLKEAKEPNPNNYPSFNAFFTRALKPDSRPLTPKTDHLLCPADGCISQIGDIHQNQLLQAKGHSYSLYDLLGPEHSDAAPFTQGSFATIYLAPKDYHRVHMPFDANLHKMLYIPGQLFPVNFRSATTTPNLFARNERVVTFYETPEFGKVALVLVGAMIVGSIETIWSGVVSPPRGQLRSWHYNPSIHLKRGDEMGRFLLGSTVIVLTEKKMHWEQNLKEKYPVQMGQALGAIKRDQL